MLPISALVVPTIATPLRNTVKVNVTQLPHLCDLPLAHPITQDDSFTIFLLIQTDYYWDLVENHIIRGNGPTTMSSKLGYLLSGPLPTAYILTTHTISIHVMISNSFGNWNPLEPMQQSTLPPMERSSQTILTRMSAANLMAPIVPSCHENQITRFANQPTSLLETNTLPCQPPGTNTNITWYL